MLPALIWVMILNFGARRDGYNRYMQAMDRARIRFKIQSLAKMRPFTCAKCMAGWTVAPYAYFTDPACSAQPWFIPVYMLGTIALTVFLEKFWFEIKNNTGL